MTAEGRDLLHPLLSARWSPTTFDPEAVVTSAEVASLLEAARWSPSAGNSQPWAFIVARRGESDHDRLVRHLARSSSRWAPTAGLLVANLTHLRVADTDWDYSEFAAYDLGQAVAHMTFQAQSLGMAMRQFRAFDREKIAAAFDVASHWEVTTMSAIGRVPTESTALGPDVSDGRPARERRPSEQLRWPGADIDQH